MAQLMRTSNPAFTEDAYVGSSFGFDAVHQATRAAWGEALSTIGIRRA